MPSVKLRTRVTEARRTKVDLTLPAAAAENLADLVPDDLIVKFEQRAIDVQAIARNAVARDLAPGELFQFHAEDKDIRVWLA